MSRSYAQATESFYQRQATAIVHRLRDLADEVERSARPISSRIGGYQDGLPEYVPAAERVVHAVMWAMANANLDGLISAAMEADRMTRNPEANPTKEQQ